MLLTAVGRLKNAAEIRNDEHVLMEQHGGSWKSSDPVAGDIVIHSSCQSIYANKHTLLALQKSTAEKLPSDPYDRAFDILADDMKAWVIEGLEVLQMSDLSQQFIQLLAEFGIHQPQYRNEKLKKKCLKKEFGEQISFWHPKFWHGSEIIFSDVPPGLTVQAGMPTASQLEDYEIVNDEIEAAQSYANKEVSHIYKAMQM